MFEIILPNEVMLDTDEKLHLKECVRALSTVFFSEIFEKRKWSVTRAERVQASVFLTDMEYFRSRNTKAYNELCKAIDDRNVIGVFEFQLSRTAGMSALPGHVVGESLLVITDENEINPIWTNTSLVSS